MQRRDGSWGVGFNAADFAETFNDIVWAARAWYHQEPRDFPFSAIKFVCDNTFVHNLLEEELDDLDGPCGPLASRDQIVRAPRYSGDIMQCIEHVHAIICSAWWLHRFEDGECVPELRESELSGVFFNLITASEQSRNVAKLRLLLKYIVAEGTGGYADPRLV